MSRIVFLFCFLLMSLNLAAQRSWEEWTSMADSLDVNMQFGESLSYRSKALEAAKTSPDSIKQLLLGLQMFTQAEYDFSETKRANDEAYALMQDAVGVLLAANAAPERISKAYWDLNLAAFNYMRNQDDTEKFLNKSIAYHLKSAEIDTLLLLNTMHGSGYMALLSGNYDKSIETLEKAITLFDQYQAKEDEDSNLKGYFYSNLALVHSPQFLNVPQKVLQYLREVVHVFAAMDDPDLEYFVGGYIALAKAERAQRNYKNAEGYLNKALRLYEGNKEQYHANTMHYVGFKMELDIYTNLIIVYRDTDDKERMLETFARVEHLAENHEFDQTEQNQYAYVLQMIAQHYLHQEGDMDKANQIIDQALRVVVRKTAIHHGNAAVGLQVERAHVHLLKKDYQQSLQIIQQIAQGYTLQTHQIELKAKNLLGLRRTDAANGAVNQLLVAIAEDNRDFQFPQDAVGDFTPGYDITDAESLVGMAEAYRDYYQAYSLEEEKLYWMALAQMESNMSNTPLNKELKKTFDKIVSGLMEAALERDFPTMESNRLLTFMEMRTSLDLVNNFLLKREVAGNTQLYQWVEEEQYVRSYITYLKKELQKSDNEDMRQRLFEKELELKELNEQLATQYRQSQLFALPEIDIASVSDKNVIKFSVAGDALFKTRIYNGELTYQKIADYPALKQAVENYLGYINDLGTPVNMIKQQGKALYNKLVKGDFDHGLPTVIIPDDILHYLPFELLVKDGAYLIEDHTISYVSNFYFLNPGALVKNKRKNKKVAFFAPAYTGTAPESLLAVRGAPYSLAGAEAEVKGLAQFVSGDTYLGEAASKAMFRSLGSDVSVLHLAMHSNLNDREPELSSLLFSSSEPDYEMYISELYGLNFNSHLAVLSACNTGVGGFQDGGNLVSMHHAFTIAGIPATVASLWNAPDESTKEIMIAFYKNLQNGDDKAMALQQAKLDYLRSTADENLKHPFYWAGFVLSGDVSAIELAKHPFWKKTWFIYVLVIAGAGIVLVLRKKPPNEPSEDQQKQ